MTTSAWCIGYLSRRDVSRRRTFTYDVFAGYYEIGRSISGNCWPYETACDSWLTRKSSSSGYRNYRSIEKSTNSLDELYTISISSSFYAGVAQLARARPCQGRGRRFESGHPLHKHHRGVFLFLLFYMA